MAAPTPKSDSREEMFLNADTRLQEGEQHHESCEGQLVTNTREPAGNDSVRLQVSCIEPSRPRREY